jgi:hypothetical protein
MTRRRNLAPTMHNNEDMHLFLAVLFDTLCLVKAGQATIVPLIQPPVLHYLNI